MKRRTGLGPKIHPSSTITASPGTEVGIIRTQMLADPEVDSLPSDTSHPVSPKW